MRTDGKSRLDENGREVLDPTPLATAVGFKRPESLAQMVARLCRGVISDRAAEQGYETEEEADDFDCEDDEFLGDHMPVSPYEHDFSRAKERIPEVLERDGVKYKKAKAKLPEEFEHNGVRYVQMKEEEPKPVPPKKEEGPIQRT